MIWVLVDQRKLPLLMALFLCFGTKILAQQLQSEQRYRMPYRNKPRYRLHASLLPYKPGYWRLALLHVSASKVPLFLLRVLQNPTKGLKDLDCGDGS